MRTVAKVTQMGMDCHKNFSRVTARDASGKVLWRQRLEHGDRQQFREQLRSWPAGTPVVLEGTFGWGWISDELGAAGVEPHLASSRKTAAWRDARGLAKSNKIDADLLSELWTQQPRWWEVWLAPQAVRDQREQLRYRMTLVRMQTGIKNRIHATLHRHGIVHDYSDAFGTAGLKFLQNLIESDTLRPSTRTTLSGYLQLLRQVRQQIAQATRELSVEVRASVAGELWRSLPGVSWVLAYTILAEVGDVRRFRDAGHLCSYSLVVPVADDSGDEEDATPIGRHVGHLGRRTLKWALIDAARGAVRKSAYFRAIFNRRTDNAKRDKCRGYIAVARELCRVGYSCVSKGHRFSEAPPPRQQRRQPEQDRRQQDEDLLVRECVGPDRPLAAVLA